MCMELVESIKQSVPIRLYRQTGGYEKQNMNETKHEKQTKRNPLMNKSLLIVADLGLLRIYRETQNVGDRPPHLELVEELKPESAHQKLSDQHSNQAGRFPRGSGAANISGDLSAGESLNAGTEQQRRNISQLAERINAFLADDDVTRCSIAISSAIHNQLLDAIAPKARAKIGQVLASNLTKTDPTELHTHFEK